MSSTGKRKPGKMSKIRLYATLAAVSIAIMWLLSSQRNNMVQTTYTIPEELSIRLKQSQRVNPQGDTDVR